ncbi:MAG: methylated-DNA--[protein]-cysteine S-methyltransferase [Acholeplasmataceae bacterium]|nr:methylated-DNA--[protein]-cysteine S-methyltransferase [Acholeplasmataceae bacterium]
MIGKFKSPMGMIFFMTDGNHLTDMMIDDLNLETDQDPLIEETIKQLSEYFSHDRKKFNLPIKYQRGTPFQQEVWNALLTIPYGQTRSYKDIAIQIGRPKAIRAVGQACKMNPIGIVVPCHRVIGKDGSMRGYSGPLHVDLKQKLILFEK